MSRYFGSVIFQADILKLKLGFGFQTGRKGRETFPFAYSHLIFFGIRQLWKGRVAGMPFSPRSRSSGQSGRGQPCPISRSPPRPLCICLPVPSPPTSSNRCGAAILRRQGCYGAPLGHRDACSTIPRVKSLPSPGDTDIRTRLWSVPVFPSHTLVLPLARVPTLLQGCLFFLPLSDQESGSILLP